MAAGKGAAGGGSREDPIERLGKMIDERIAGAFENRDRQQKESSDPWARLEGVIDRSVSKHFEAFTKGLEEGMAREGKPAGKAGDEGDGEDGGKILGVLFG